MSDTQAQHHAEQMEAARRDFDRVFRSEILPRVEIMFGKPAPRAVGMLMDACWHAFKAGQQTNPQP